MGMPDPLPLVIEELAGGRPCRNCGASVSATFCGDCGERQVVGPPTLRQLVQDVASDIFKVDSKMVRTAAGLMRPGFLTREYFEGRRGRYIRPFKVYLLASVLYFATSSAYPVRNWKFSTTPSAVEKAAAAPNPGAATRFFQSVERGIKSHSPEELGQSVNQYVDTYMPRLMFGLIPVFAVLLKLLYVRRGRLYSEHFIFTLHFHAFAFLTLAIARPVQELGSAILAKAFGWISMIAPLAYLFVALRRVYKQSALKTVTKQALLLGTYSTLLMMVMAAVVLFAISRTT